ncbi:sugar ABC transporter permease [Deinococcus deserti]|uniref:Putative sugar ABC transporter, permease component n=2 Tax=Deinococcus TaxID=1298 RepID=C1D3P9_DEIDV|nr:sugar ABC transporter permease [Deinococcus deserti]ACO48128.2 putative sugar ABC transporter, permease component [Deinococcus deserti VCD115]
MRLPVLAFRGRGAQGRPADNRTAWLMLAPLLTIILLIVGYPLVRTLYLSFTAGILTAVKVPPRWVGWENYTQALTNPEFLASLWNSAYFTSVSVGLEMILGVLVALLLHQQFRGRKFVRALLILPWAIPTIVNAVMWRWIFNPEFGAFNALLTQTNVLNTYQSWLGEPGLAMNMVILADVWKNYPIVALIALAALQGVPDDVYEAASLDGANAWTRFWRITFPDIVGPLSVALVLRTIEAFKVFDIVFVMTRGGPADSTKTASFHVYQESFTYLRAGSGASYAYIVVLISMLLIGAYMWLLRRQAQGART